MYKITMRAAGVSETVGAEAARDIEAEFREHRRWQERVTCSFEGGVLTLVAFNDYDENGLALSDEFSDLISAFIPLGGISDDEAFEIVSVEVVDNP